MAYDDTNRFVLFKNNQKRGDKSPDYQGNLNVNGVKFDIAAWIQESGPNSKSPGMKFMSGRVSPKEDAQQQQQPATAQTTQPKAQPQSGAGPIDEDSIPF